MLSEPALVDIIDHRNYRAARSALLGYVQNHRPGRIIVVIGLSGNGKTTIRRSVMREIFGLPHQWPIGSLPVAEVMALLPLGAYFAPKAFAYDSVKQLLVPDLRWLMRMADDDDQAAKDYSKSLEEGRSLWLKQPRKNESEPMLWSRFGDLAIDRQLKAFSVEHADALCINHKDKTPADHIQNLMSVMESAESMAVLTCVQDGFKLWAGRSEIRERMDVVWVLPYDVTVKSDREAYLSMLKTACGRYRFDPAGLPGVLAPEIALVTATGLRGIFSLLDKALHNATSSGRSAITKVDLESAYPTTLDINTLVANAEILREAHRAEPPREVTRRANELWCRK